MEAVRQSTLPPHQRLTQLYSDTKQSYRAVSPPRLGDDTSDFARLQAKSQIQKDRLTAWGLGWSDDASAAKLSIDESVERAGLTDVVSSVLESIQSLLTQVEKMRPQRANYSPSSPIEKRAPPDLNQGSWSEADKNKYEDLVKDLTSAIDVLYDLTKWRRTAFEESQASVEQASANTSFSEPKASQIPRKALPLRSQSFSDITPAPHANSRIDISTLVLPDEPPPPYHSLNSIISPRVLGYAQRRNPMLSVGDKDDGMVNVPVLVEYANYDPSYRTNGMSPPLSRLDEILHAFHSPGHLASSDSLLPLAGYFEDPNHSRFGLVYELPASAYLSTIGHSVDAVKPNSLLSILQASQKSDHVTGSIPPLEQRFRLALELAQVFSLLQENEISHRDVSSSNIIFFSSPPSDSSSNPNKSPAHDFRKPYLCSFDLFSDSLTPGETPLNLYRHPDDPRVNGSSDIEKSAFRFDVYGLGLILLEVGIWAPLSEFYKSKYSMAEFRQRIKSIWMRRLADRCGSAYVRIVQACLEAGNEKSSGSLRDVCISIVPRLRRLCLSHEEFLPDDGFDHYLPRLPKLSESDQLWQSQPYPDEKSSPTFSPHLSESPVMAAPLDTKSHHQIILKSDDLADRKRPQNISRQKGHRGKRQEFPGKELPQHILKQWDEIGSSLASIVNHALRHSGESSSIGLTCTGYSEESAKPTFLITCTSTCRVRQVLKRKFHFDKDVFDLVIVKGGIVRSKAGATRRGPQRPRRSGAHSTSTCSTEPLNPFHQIRPLCGASIGAFKDNEHLPPVSYGGVVIIDGQHYGMSVHHLIEDPEDDEDDVASLNIPTRSSATVATTAWGGTEDSYTAFSDDPSYFSGMDYGSNLAGAYPSMLEIDEDEYDSDEEMESMMDDLSDDDDEVDEENDVSGDREGIAEGDGEEIVITQPALEDVSDDFFPSEEDKDDDHLDSHTLGHIHASSGIRRWNRDGIQHEIDWALIKLKKDRLQPQNLVPGGKRFCPTATKVTKPTLAEPVCRGSYKPGEDLYPLSIANSAQMSDLYVHCFGRTSGLQGGKISKTMDFVKFPGRKSFSKSWYVVGNFGIGGDSGAWVIDNNGGSICGHVLAWSAALSRAYISPMDVMFEDIRRTLGATEVSLPGAERRLERSVVPQSMNADPVVMASQSDLETSLSKLTMTDHHQNALPYPRNGKQAATSVSIRESPQNLLAQHFLLSGSPGHLEREWTSRRRTLGQKIRG